MTEAVAGLSGAAAAGASSNPELGQAVRNLSTSPTDYAIDHLMAPAPAAAGGNQAAGNPAAGGQVATPPSYDNGAISRAFAASLKSGQLAPTDRDMLTGMVMQRTGLSQADAQKRVDDTFAQLKQAEQKARDTAESARKAALIAAFAAAAIALLSCAAACVAASAGAEHRHRREQIGLFASTRFW